MKYADDIVRAMDIRGSIKVPEDCFASEEFDIWMYGKEEEVEKSSIVWSNNNVSSKIGSDNSYITNYGDAA